MFQRKIERRAAPIKPSPPTMTHTSLTSQPVDEPCPVYEVIPEPEEEVYVTLADFRAPSTGDGLSFSAGCSVTVVTKNASGWWYVEMGDKEGWVPSSYLERAPKNEMLHVPPPKLPAKSSPVKRRELTQSGKSALRRSTSEETLKQQQLKPSPTHKPRVNSPPVKPSSWMTASTPHMSSHHHQHQQQQLKPTMSVPVQTSRKTPTSTAGGKTHSPLRRSSSSEGQARPRPHLTPRSQQSTSNLGVPKPHVRSHSSGGSSNTRDGAQSSRTDNKPVSELAQILQKKQVASSAAKTSSSPRATPKTVTPTTTSPSTKRLDLSVKQQPPQRPKPYSGSATAKRAPPKRPEPPKSSTIAARTKKTPPPRPSTSPAQTRKTSVSYTAVCEYAGGDGQMPLTVGQNVEVLEKSSDGWWYVKAGSEEGWAPSSFLEEGKSKPSRPANGPSHLKQENPTGGSSKPTPAARPVPKPRRSPQVSHSSSMYRAAASYQVPVYEDSGIDLVAGQMYEVLEKQGGWWFVKDDSQREGWAPASYLDPT